MACYWIRTVPTVNAKSADEAVAAAKKLGYPVVLKLWSEIITHKTDAGGVILNLGDDTAVKNAFAQIKDNAISYAQQHYQGRTDWQSVLPDAFLGVTVQPMVRMKGYELIVG